MMASRKKLIQLLIYFFSSLNFSFSDIIIKNNTEWLRNKNITQNVIVKPGATLTIKENVSIYIQNDNKVKLVIVGSSVIILFQFLIHIGVNIRMFPTTGMTLPFLSYGGSSIIGTSILSGIILNLTKKNILK